MQLSLVDILASNKFPVTELCLRTPDGKPLRAKIDTAALPKILSISSVWHAYWHPWARTHYVCALTNGKKFYLHRVVTDAPPGKVVDHKKHNGLDNRNSELRVVIQGENVRNARRRDVNKCGSRGITFIPVNRLRPWCARVKVQGKVKVLGYFSAKEAAAQAVGEFLKTRGIEL